MVGEAHRRRASPAACAPSLSWDDDPFLDSLEAVESAKVKEEDIRKGGGRSKGRREKEKARSRNGKGSASGGRVDMWLDRMDEEKKKKDKARTALGQNRKGAGPLVTSISSIFGGGSSGPSRDAKDGKGQVPRKRPRPSTPIHTSQASTTAATNSSKAAESRPKGPWSRLGRAKRSDKQDGKMMGIPGLQGSGSWGRGLGDDGGADDDTWGASRYSGMCVGQADSGGSFRPVGVVGGRSGWGQGGQGFGKGKGGVEDELWPEKHCPTSLEGLAMHHKKLDEVRHWMTQATNQAMNQQGLSIATGGRKRVLCLVGPPGCAKSTMVRLLAESMGIALIEWQDTSGQGGPMFRPTADGPALRGARPRHELGSSYESQIDSFENFIRSSMYPTLSLVGASSLARKGQEGGSFKSSGSRVGGRGGVGPHPMHSHMMLIEDLPLTHGEEKRKRLQRVMVDYIEQGSCPLILVWSQSSEHSSYQAFLEQVLSREVMRLPGVQVTTCNPVNATMLRKHLKAVLSKEGISDPTGGLVEEAILTCEGDIRHALLGLQVKAGRHPSPCPGNQHPSISISTCGNGVTGGSGADGWERRWQQSQGKPQLLKTSGRSWSGSSSASSTSHRGSKGRVRDVRGVAGARGMISNLSSRDMFLSQFHALGKLLYAKRLPQGEGGGDGEAEGGRGKLSFDPEEVMSRGGMGLEWGLTFLQCHCVDFFTEEADLSEGLGYMSDADLFVAHKYSVSAKGSDEGGEVFPGRYVESIASRAVAATNKHPAKSRMRSFSAPESFEVRRRMIANRDALARFVANAWEASEGAGSGGGGQAILWASSRHPQEEVATDLVPVARVITGKSNTETALHALLDQWRKISGKNCINDNFTSDSTATQSGAEVLESCRHKERDTGHRAVVGAGFVGTATPRLNEGLIGMEEELEGIEED